MKLKENKAIDLAIIEIIKELDTRIIELTKMKNLIVSNILNISKTIEPYKTFIKTQVAITGSAYIHVEELPNNTHKSIRIANHKNKKNNRKTLLENIILTD